MTLEELAKKSSLTAAELAAVPAMPRGLLSPFHEVRRLSWDEARGTGRVEAVRRNGLSDWYYGCHFLGDPVMPGCWGIDALWQCLRVFAAWRGLSRCTRTMGMEDAGFFGQIRPYDREIVYGVDVTSVEGSGEEALVEGKGTVHVDGVPVYTVGKLQVAGGYWESSLRAPAAAAVPGAAPFTRRLSYEEFCSRRSLTRPEVIALSLGSLVEAPPVEMALLPDSLMLQIGEVRALERDERTGEGRVRAVLKNDPSDWFYPMNGGVKPAALSIDAVWQLMGLYLAWSRAAGTGRALGFERVEVFDEIVPADREIQYELKILKLVRSPEGDTFARADAHVFADGRPILSCANANVGCHKNIRYSDYPRDGELARGGKLKTRDGGRS